jgi:hypothetical protein
MAREERIADPESTGHEEPLSGEGGGAFEADSRKNPIMKPAGYVLSLPGVVLHLPVILVTLALEKWLVVDRHLVPAARWLGGMFLVPLWYLVALALCHLLTGSLPGDLILLLSMPLSLWMWSRCWHLTGWG